MYDMFHTGQCHDDFSETFSYSNSESWIIFSGFSQFALFVAAYDGI